MFTALALALLPSGASTSEIEAVRKATEAAYIQSGLAEHVHTVQSGATDFAKREMRNLGVDRYIGVVGGGYQIYRSQTLTLHLSRKSVLTVHTDSAFVTFSF